MCDNWLGDTAELQDDMTFVIIKKDNSLAKCLPKWCN